MEAACLAQALSPLGAHRQRSPSLASCTALLETQDWPQLGNTTWLITREKSPCDASPSRGLCLQAWFLQRCTQRLGAEPANHARAGAALLHPLLGAPGRNAERWEQKQRGQHGGTHLLLAPDGREFCRTDRGAVPSPAATCNGGDTASEKHRAEVDQNQVLFPFRFMQAGPFWLPSCALTLGTRSPGQTIAMVQFQTGFPIQVVFLSGHTDRGNLWRP